jgi:hypothetical protein
MNRVQKENIIRTYDLKGSEFSREAIHKNSLPGEIDL